MFKRCNRCNQDKPLDDFAPHSEGKLGRRAKCRECLRDYENERRAADPERARARMQRWRERHPERSREDNARYYRENIDAERERHRRYQSEHPEKAREYAANHRQQGREKSARWRAAHPDEVRIMAYRAQVNRRAAVPITDWHTDDEWAAKLASFGGVCARCGSDQVTKDHIVALAAGGTDCIKNVQPLCKPCNSKKARKEDRAAIKAYRESVAA